MPICVRIVLMHPNSKDTDSSGETFDSCPVLVDRTAAYDALVDGLNSERYLYLYGAKGTGKTVLTQHILDEVPDRTAVTYLSCLTHNTQYKVLTALYAALTGDDPATGYHTAQLSDAITEILSGRDLLLILDDIDFLLLNDGADLLYFLSRLAQDCTPRLLMLSANHPDLSTQVDDRIYSSLLPYTVCLEPYTDEETVQVLDARAADWVDQSVTAGALAHIAATTANIRFGRHWLTVAAEIVDGEITEEVIRLAQTDARQRYRTALLAPFSVHHHFLLDAIDLLAADTEPVRSGAVYYWYRELCKQDETEPLSNRRLSDYLKQLELLDLIRAEYQYGGDDGKTRHIWLQEF